MNIKRKILFATTNENKIKRIQKLTNDLDIELLTLSDIQEKIEEPKEFGKDVVEIAKNKAFYYCEDWENNAGACSRRYYGFFRQCSSGG
ncbi:MAG: Non-canonical purine NTP pyrophosphatase [candidate division WWE3 bacterium GW2011_GWA2_44_16]|uniref:Non-canonical purine NTP pyrophosphatase n=1 Tax=candidate division WWE3 bacterium GW2011_GWA2_44_16 TaxID=1619110 RepID=A0A0G1HET4_UNCKA|nr:MAG: Non-canonical purine NTP pyrophosphatase [candidate division WWE3 bacterium GW2011_GWA2_44_16]